jgi:hypothetical protein
MATTTTTTAVTTTTPTSSTFNKAVKEKFSGGNQPMGILTAFNGLIAVGLIIVVPWLSAIGLQSPDASTKALAGVSIAFSVLSFILGIGILIVLYALGCNARAYGQQTPGEVTP